jgi:hypothetical protein
MRLALALGRTLRELDDSLGSDELPLWRAFQGLYDLPDGFLVASRLGPPLAGLAGVSQSPEEVCPYYQRPRPSREALDAAGVHPSVRRFAAMAKAFARHPS